VRVEFVDDLSADDSREKVYTFKSLLGIPDAFLDGRANVANCGTYWIRNDVIHRHPEPSTTFFINDSDDYSAAQRVFLQLSLLDSDSSQAGCFCDIVRIASDYQLLPLNDEVERYGTASLCFKRNLIDTVGYFQNLRKNADTEFIERVKQFKGKGALQWYRYPVLFQTFDGENLTADIYAFRADRRGLSSGSNARPIHVEAFRRHHDRIKRKHLELSSEFRFPISTLAAEYEVIPSEFIVGGYKGVDDAVMLVGQKVDRSMWEPLLKWGLRVGVACEDGSWCFYSQAGDEFTSDQGFIQAMRQYSLRTGFHGYVFSHGLIMGWVNNPLPLEPLPLLSPPLRTYVYESKRHGDLSVHIGSTVKLEAAEIKEALNNYLKGYNVGAQLHKPIFFHSSLIVKKGIDCVSVE